MNIWACPTADKRGFIGHLIDTYKKELIYVTDLRQVYNSLTVNYTVINDTRTMKFKDEQTRYRRLITPICAELASTHLVCHDWYTKEMIESIDLFFLHKEGDADNILRMLSPTSTERAADVTRLHDNWLQLAELASQKVVTMEYEDRLEHFFDIVEQDGIVTARPKTDLIAERRSKRRPSKDQETLRRFLE